MDHSKIVVLGVKGTVLAYNQETGESLWKRPLKPGISEHFVTVVADTKRVYAHTKGELFCLDLFTGNLLWQDGLAGLGFGLATIAIPGQTAPSAAVMAAVQKQRQDSSTAATSGTTH
jgi:outer membrane protein assembly factor BamB